MSDHDSEVSPEVESMNGSFSTNGYDTGAIASAFDSGGSGQDLSFLDDLAKAMRTTAAAEQARDAELTEQRRQAHLDAIRAREALEAEDLRELAKEDVKGIDAWSDGEIKRIKLERERRIASRREQLQVRLEEHRMVIASEVEAVEAALASYRIETERFFDRLGSQTDPVEIARQAGTRPPFPALDQIGPEAAAAPAVAAYQAPVYEAPAPMSAPAVIAGIEAVQATETVEPTDDRRTRRRRRSRRDGRRAGSRPMSRRRSKPSRRSRQSAIEPPWRPRHRDGRDGRTRAGSRRSSPKPSSTTSTARLRPTPPSSSGSWTRPPARPTAESPWESGVEAIDESAGIGATVDAVAHAVEGASEGGNGSEEPVSVGAEARVVMPRTTGGAGSWLRWPNSSIDRSDPSR